MGSTAEDGAEGENSEGEEKNRAPTEDVGEGD